MEFESLTIDEIDTLYSVVDDIVDTLDADSVGELLDVSSNDFEKLSEILIEETYNVLTLGDYDTSLSKKCLHNLPNVLDGYETYLRKANLGYFVQTVLPSFDLTYHCLEWFSMIQLYRLLCVIAARDHSKSFSFSFANVLWRLYRYTRPSAYFMPPDDIRYYKEGMLITNEFKLAKRLLKKVKDEIKTNEILFRALYPANKDDGAWTESSLLCKNGSEITLSSFRTSNRGPHPGWIVVDDFLDKSAMYSKEQREKFKEVFFAEVMNMILPQGQVSVVGTPFHEQDLYHDLKEDPAWQVFEYPAIFPDGSVLYPTRYDYDALLSKRRTLGSLIFSREILVKPVSDSTSIFPWTILKKSWVGMEKYKLQYNRASFPVNMRRVAIGVDWAISGEVGADNTWFVVLGEDFVGAMWLMAALKLHGAGYMEQLTKLQMLNLAFRADVVSVEVNGFQKVMSNLATNMMNMTNIIEEVTGNTKKDMYEGLPALAVYFERGMYHFPRGDEHSCEITDMICSELNSVAFDDDTGKLESVSEHDDAPMALYFATKALKSVNGTFRVSV